MGNEILKEKKKNKRKAFKIKQTSAERDRKDNGEMIKEIIVTVYVP